MHKVLLKQYMTQTDQENVYPARIADHASVYRDRVVAEVCSPKYMQSMKVEALLKDSVVKTASYIWYLLWNMIGTMKMSKHYIRRLQKKICMIVYTLYKAGNEENVCTFYLKDTQQICGGKMTNIMKNKFMKKLKLWMKEEGILLTKYTNNRRFQYNDTVGYLIMHSVLKLYSIRCRMTDE